MKRLLFFGLLFAFGAMNASAEWITLYETHKKGDESDTSYAWYKIDRENKKWYFDSDSESDANMLIKNYKKSGNKETFDLEPEIKDGAGMKHHVELVSENGVETEIKITCNNYSNGWYMLSREPRGKKSSASSKPDTSAEGVTEAATESATDKVKSSGKKLLNKGKNLFKKK